MKTGSERSDKKSSKMLDFRRKYVFMKRKTQKSTACGGLPATQMNFNVFSYDCFYDFWDFDIFCDF